jgi:PAS domain-containing protein
MDNGSVEENSREVILVEAVNGSRSVEALPASEANYRTLFEAIDQGLAISEVILNVAGEGVDCRIIEANASFERLTGKSREQLLSGKTVRELIPTLEDAWPMIMGRVAVNGEPLRFENYVAALDRWIEVYAFRMAIHYSDGSLALTTT